MLPATETVATMNGFLNHVAHSGCPVYPDVVLLGRNLRLQLSQQTMSTTVASLMSSIESIHGVGAFAAYVASQPYLQQRSLDEQLGSFICFGVPGQTDWFRDRDAFRALKYEVLPTYPITTSVRIASVGCSTGMEVYSALLAAATPGRAFTVLGVDINPASLTVARQGIFPGRKFRPEDPWSLLPIQFQDKVLVDPCALALHIKRMGTNGLLGQSWFGFTPPPGVVAFQQHDIVARPLHLPVDVALLLKVRMHFPAATRIEILRNLRRSITDGGWLVSDSEDALLPNVVAEFQQAGFTKVPVSAPGWWGGPEDITNTTSVYRITNPS